MMRLIGPAGETQQAIPNPPNRICTIYFQCPKIKEKYRMAFTTKKYTRPLLVKELKKVKVDSFFSLKTLAQAISPRTGTKSAKIAALRSYVGARNLSALFQIPSVFTKEEMLKSLKN